MKSGTLALIWILVAIWGLGLYAMIARLWYFQIVMLNNLSPDRTPGWRGGFFDASRYNAAGQEAHRKMLSFYWKVVAFGLGGLLAISIIGVALG